VFLFINGGILNRYEHRTARSFKRRGIRYHAVYQERYADKFTHTTPGGRDHMTICHVVRNDHRPQETRGGRKVTPMVDRHAPYPGISHES